MQRAYQFAFRHSNDNDVNYVLNFFRDFIIKLVDEIQESVKKNAGIFSGYRDLTFSRAHLAIRIKLYDDLIAQYDSKADNDVVIGNMVALLDAAIDASVTLQMDALQHKNPAATDSQGKKIKCHGYKENLPADDLLQKMKNGAVGVDKHLSMTKAYYVVTGSQQYRAAVEKNEIKMLVVKKTQPQA